MSTFKQENKRKFRGKLIFSEYFTFSSALCWISFILANEGKYQGFCIFPLHLHRKKHTISYISLVHWPSLTLRARDELCFKKKIAAGAEDFRQVTLSCQKSMCTHQIIALF